jgi:U3 small nucleolar RNA-associated protein 14
VRFADVDLDEGGVEDRSRTDHILDEDDSEEEEEQVGQFVDVLDVLDGRAKPYLASDDEEETSHSSPSHYSPLHDEHIMGGLENGHDDEEMESEVGYQEEEQSEEEGERQDEADEEYDIGLPDPAVQSDDDALSVLDNFILGLDHGISAAEKRKSEGQEEDHRPRKRRSILERNEAGPENEFGGRISGMYMLHLQTVCVNSSICVQKNLIWRIFLPLLRRKHRLYNLSRNRSRPFQVKAVRWQHPFPNGRRSAWIEKLHMYRRNKKLTNGRNL